MQMLDPASEAGARTLDRLEHELMGWMTTVDPDGQPQSSPIWFLWQDGTILVYSHVRAPRNANGEANPRVTFNLNTDADGDDVATMEGEAPVNPALPPPPGNRPFQANNAQVSQ